MGHAGASGYLAAMVFLSVPPEVMRPTALVLNLFVATIATYRFARAGPFSHSLLWPFAIASVPLAFVGGAMQLPGHWYKTLVGVVLAAVRLLRERSGEAAPEAARPHRHVSMPLAITFGGIIGLLSGLTGTGGGIFLSPLLLFTGWAETRETTRGVSAAFILVNSASALAGNLISINSASGTSALGGAAVIGGLIGSELGSRRVATTTFRRLLSVVLLVAGSKLMLT